MREGRKCRGREKRGGLALEKQNLKQRERRMNPELQLLLTRGFQGLPLIWDGIGMDINPYCWEQKGFVSWG